MRGHSAQRAYESAIPYARRWLALDPLHEPVHRCLMQLYAQTGQRAAALHQYHECVRVLEAELGLPPSKETTSLYEHIRAQPDGQATFLLPLPTPKHNLPAQTTPFVGRRHELAEIEVRLNDPDCHLLTLVGPGGSGKTRLALEAAMGQLEKYEHGVFFVSLAPLRSVDGIVPTVAEALGFRFYTGTAPQQQLLDYLHQKNMLIIMDNFEHLLSPPSIPPAGGERAEGDPTHQRKAILPPPAEGERGGEGLVTEILCTL
ncbi:MAG: AAA family ATPase [Anaerolineae bacterium]|nr:AAA family ATPase [Anaerolineae bacterium]